MAEEVKQSAWETESGLVDDIDGWVTNPRFGTKEEYASVVVQESETDGVKGLMFLIDLMDEKGEIIASQGWSVGTGWTPNDDGSEISHPKRNNVVHNTLYGQLQNIVVKELGVEMDKFGIPTIAASWDKLGFHWMIKEHDTVGGKKGKGLMPTQFLGKMGEEEKKATAKTTTTTKTQTKAVKPKTESGVSDVEKEALKLVAQSKTVKEFQLRAMKVPAIVSNDALMSKCLDDGPDGFYAQNKG